MNISFCTTCHKRLWQLQKTIEHNLAYTKVGEVELCVLLYNDWESYSYILDNYLDYIADGRLRIKYWQEDRIFRDGSRWSCGYVKDLAHSMGKGEFLFNLDADNFIDDTLIAAISELSPTQFIITLQSEWKPDGRSGRIGVPRAVYGNVRYRDRGKGDDGDFMTQCVGLRLKAVQVKCENKPIDNER